MSAFVGKYGRPYTYGGLAEIANDEGIVFVFFHHVSLAAHCEEKAYDDRFR